MQWVKISRDDYESKDGRCSICRMPASLNGYGKRDEWTLALDGEGVDVYSRLQDAKKAAEEIANRDKPLMEIL